MSRSQGKRAMEILISVGLFLFLFSATLVHSQSEMGYISIDCGSPQPFYKDPDTAISYTSDEPYVDSGTNRNISVQYQYPNDPILPLPLSDLRIFPQGLKNCYTLSLNTKQNGGLNLIRASFYYANYDGLNKPPEFDLYLDVNLWTTVKFRNVSEAVRTEIIASVLTDTVHVCLVNKGLGVPFISALELRPLNKGLVYGTEFGANASLVLFERLDIGETNMTGRYSDDAYDRVWSSYVSSSWETIRTNLSVDNHENGYRVPQEVIRTAARPKIVDDSIVLEWSGDDLSSMFYVFMHFAEVESLAKNQTRKFNVTWNGNPLFGPLSPRNLYATTVSNLKPLVGKDHRISIRETEGSTLPPILNAFEVYLVRKKDELPTYSEDAQAIAEVKRMYRITKSWSGDPCGPRNFSWQGLECSYNTSIPPRIISLNLSSSNLSGIIAPSIFKLSSLKSLDLSNNNLSGSVPESLKDLKSLKMLYLKGNQLSGVVPNELLKRSKQGLLELSVDSRNISKKKNNIVAPIVASLASAIVLLIILLLIIWKQRRKRKSEISTKSGGHVSIKKSIYSYAEVVEITKNFETKIGKGGFGPVYHGYMKDGTEVAVKILSSSSSQGPREFQTEAELLLRIHHRNLASFVGYCDDGDKLALIYEYMPNGNLKEYLSEKNLQLSWEKRLRIAVDAAQGLEYLHNGCKPPIVHRDVKTANILLGEKLDAKIADFGLSKVFTGDNDTQVETTIMGTAGYLDPEYYSSQKLTEKSDVFSFGVVLLELITGQPAIIKTDETVHIIHWTSSELEEGDIRRVVDPRIRENFDEESVGKALEVAMACTITSSEPRAAMSFVLQELKHCLEIELSKDYRDRSTELTARNYNYRNYYSSSTHELSSIYTDSMKMESITTPLAR